MRTLAPCSPGRIREELENENQQQAVTKQDEAFKQLKTEDKVSSPRL